MPYTFNPFTQNFDYYQAAAGGDVVGPASSTDNAVARFDGATGLLLQNSTVIIDDSGNTTGQGNITMTTGSAIRTAVVAGNTFLMQAYDVDGTAYTTFMTFTANNTPTLDLSDAVTKAGAYIYRAGGTDVPITDGGTGASTAAGAATNLGLGTSDSPTFANVTLATGGALRTSTGVGNTALLQAYNTGGASYTTFATLTAGALPTLDLNDLVTKNGSYIYRAGGNDVAVSDGGTGVSTITGLLSGNGTSALVGRTITGTANQITVTNGDGATANPTLTIPAAFTAPGSVTSTGILTSLSGIVVTRLAPGAYPYTVLSTDYIVEVNTSAARTINLPNAPTTGTVYVIKDVTGTAAAFNITLTTVGGAVLIDGTVSKTLNTNYLSVTVFFNGTSYFII